MIKTIDERFKDSSPVETVSNIKQLLGSNGLSVKEDWYENSVCNCYSLRLFLNNTTLFTCGKGITKELANASAHAELMERLQSGMLGYGKLHFNDAVMMDRDTLAKSCDEFFIRIANVIDEFETKSISPDRIIDACFDYEGDSNLTEAIPYYSVTDDKMVYLPSRLMIPLFTSTGNCAGNTAEEAIVQGISEIIERWNQRHFMCKDLIPPTIPDDYLQNFPVAYETITEIKNAGFDVIVKDCSMETGYPVIATAVIDKKKHAYHVHMGASPVFEIALGRSLTETFQGRILETIADTDLSESSKNDISTFRKSFVLGRGAYPIEFFTEESSFRFIPFPDRTGCTNFQLLEYAINYIKERNMKIYIRDMSHLGFHAYKIVVPDMCKAPFDFLTSDLQVPKLIGNTKEAELDPKNATEEQLFELQLLNLYKINNKLLDRDPKCSKLMMLPITKNIYMDRAIGYIHVGYTEWQCGNKKAALDYAKAVQKQKVPGISDFFSCYNRTLAMLKQNKDLSDILKKLLIFYDADTVNEVQDILQNNKNPFVNYVVSCAPEKGSCATCRYYGICDVEKQMHITKVINEYTATFDNEKAFEKLKALFKKLS